MKKQKQKGDTTFCLPFAYTVEDFLQAMKFPSGGEREGRDKAKRVGLDQSKNACTHMADSCQ